jgi:ATP-binding cassette subfamily D (ALD) protein 3
LDVFLFSRKLAELMGWIGPGAVIFWYFLSGVFLRFISPAFGKLIASEQRL